MRPFGQKTTRAVNKRAGSAFTLVELLVVMTIMLVVAALITGAVIRVRSSSRVQEAVTTVNELHLALEAYITEKPVPSTAAEGYDASGYLIYPEDEPKSLLQRLEQRGLFNFDRSRQLDSSKRLIDPWDQPWNLVIGVNGDANDILPYNLIDKGTIEDWQLVNAKAGPEYRIYVYSYGDGGDISDPSGWVYNKVQ